MRFALLPILLLLAACGAGEPETPLAPFEPWLGVWESEDGTARQSLKRFQPNLIEARLEFRRDGEWALASFGEFRVIENEAGQARARGLFAVIPDFEMGFDRLEVDVLQAGRDRLDLPRRFRREQLVFLNRAVILPESDGAGEERVEITVESWDRPADDRFAYTVWRYDETGENLEAWMSGIWIRVEGEET